MKKYLLLVFLIGLCTSSYSKNEVLFNSYSTVDNKKSDIKVVGYGYVQGWDWVHEDKQKIDIEKYKLKDFTRLKDGENQFSYYIMEKLDWGYSFVSYLIYEYYDSECAVWLANYTPDNQFIDAIEVYYDNAEGAFQTTSQLSLSSHRIMVIEHNDFDAPDSKTVIYTLSDKGKFTK